MNIAMISEHASPLALVGDVDAGGQNVHVAALSQALARAGNRVVVFTRRDDPSLPRRVPFRPGVDVVHVDAGPPEPIPKDEIYPYVPQFASELTGYWSRVPFDVAHAHFWMSGLATLRAARETDIPVVMTFHALGVTKRHWQGPDDTSPPAREQHEADLAVGSDHVVATARREVFDLMRMGADRRRVSLVPCGVDLDRFTAEGPEAKQPRRHRFRILSVGRLVPRKGVDTVVRALAHVPDAELLIVGGPTRRHIARDPEARRLRSIAESVGVSERVVFTGQVAPDRLPALYRSADLVASTPWYEPFGMVALEAMACGTPTVVSAVGGLVDTVIDGVTGIHVRARDHRALALVLRNLLDDADRRSQMGRLAAARARQRYSWDRVARDTTRAYLAATATVGERQRRVV